MTPRMFGELVGARPGVALVIGGGPSAPGDLLALRAIGFEPSCVLSANEHGHHQTTYAVTHSVCLDPRHGVKRIGMRELLRGYGPQPIITPCWFGDYRLAEWKLAANTGLTAATLGVFMAGACVVVGIDFYRMQNAAAGTYFHDAQAISNSNVKKPENFMRQVKAVESYIHGHPAVRALSGMLSSVWGLYSGAIVPQPWQALPQARFQREQPSCVLQAHPSIRVQFGLGTLPQGELFVCSPNEARGLVNSRRAKLIDAYPPPDQNVVNLPRELLEPGRGYARQILHGSTSPPPFLRSPDKAE